MTAPTFTQEDADGYRAAWARGGYSKESFMRAKAHWDRIRVWIAICKRFFGEPYIEPVVYICPTCGARHLLSAPPDWAKD